MKTFTKILTAAAATALLATGCVNEDPAYKNNEPGTPPDPNAKGYLTLADMSMRVVVDTDTETRPDDTSDETAKPQTRTDEAQPDVDTFIIEIRDATGKLALQETYGDLKASIGEAGRLELPVVPEGCVHNAHMFYVKAKDITERTAFIDYLKENGIMSVTPD